MSRLIVAIAVASGLIGSFAIAVASGQRLLGATTLIVVGGGCAIAMVRRSGVRPTVIAGVAYAVAFVLAHPLGRLIGSWPSVILLALAAAGVAFAVNTGRRPAKIAS